MNMNAAMNELTAALEAMDPEILAGGIFFWFCVFAAIAAAIILLGAVRYLLRAIGFARMYHKAGETPWKAFIPFYNTYTNYKISWTGKRYFLYAALYILFCALSNSTMLSLQLAGIATGIAVIVIDAVQNIRMAKLFGKGTGTGIALMLFPGIISLILGLGKAEFQAKMIENN